MPDAGRVTIEVELGALGLGAKLTAAIDRAVMPALARMQARVHEFSRSTGSIDDRGLKRTAVSADAVGAAMARAAAHGKSFAAVISSVLGRGGGGGGDLPSLRKEIGEYHGVLGQVRLGFDKFLASLVSVGAQASTWLPIIGLAGGAIGVLGGGIGVALGGVGQLTAGMVALGPAIAGIVGAVKIGFEGLKDGAKAYLKQFDDANAVLSAQIGNLMGPMLTAWQEVSSRIKLDFATALVPTFNNLGALFRSVGPGLSGVATGVAEVGNRVTATLNALAPQLNTILAGSRTLITAIGPGIQTLAAGFVTMSAAAQQAMPTIATAINGALTQVGQSFQQIAASPQFQTALAGFAQIITQIGGLIAGLGPTMVDLGAQVGPLFADFIARLGPALDILLKAFGDISTRVGPLFNEFLTGLAPVLASVIEGLGRMGEIIGPTLVPLLDALGRALQPLYEPLGQLGKQLSEQLTRILPTIGTALSTIIEPFVSALPMAGDLVVELANAVIAAQPLIVELARVIGTLLDVAINIVGQLTPVIETLGRIPGLVDAVVAAFLAWKFIAGVSALQTALTGIAATLSTTLPAAAGTGAAGIAAKLAAVTVPAWLAYLVAGGSVAAVGSGLSAAHEMGISPEMSRYPNLPNPRGGGPQIAPSYGGGGGPIPSGPPSIGPYKPGGPAAGGPAVSAHPGVTVELPRDMVAVGPPEVFGLPGPSTPVAPDIKGRGGAATPPTPPKPPELPITDQPLIAQTVEQNKLLTDIRALLNGTGNSSAPLNSLKDLKSAVTLIGQDLKKTLPAPKLPPGAVPGRIGPFGTPVPAYDPAYEAAAGALRGLGMANPEQILGQNPIAYAQEQWNKQVDQTAAGFNTQIDAWQQSLEWQKKLDAYQQQVWDYQQKLAGQPAQTPIPGMPETGPGAPPGAPGGVPPPVPPVPPAPPTPPVPGVTPTGGSPIPVYVMNWPGQTAGIPGVTPPLGTGAGIPAAPTGTHAVIPPNATRDQAIAGIVAEAQARGLTPDEIAGVLAVGQQESNFGQTGFLGFSTKTADTGYTLGAPYANDFNKALQKFFDNYMAGGLGQGGGPQQKSAALAALQAGNPQPFLQWLQSGVQGIPNTQGLNASFGPNVASFFQTWRQQIPHVGTGAVSGPTAPGLPGTNIATTSNPIPVASMLDTFARTYGSGTGQYQWGASDLVHGLADCSGAVSDLVELLTKGTTTPDRLFSTANEGQVLQQLGAIPGLIPGTLQIGFNAEHTAATLPSGVNFESGGAAGGPTYGGAAAGANASQFTQQYSLPVGGGMFPPGGFGGSVGGTVPVYVTNWPGQQQQGGQGFPGAPIVAAGFQGASQAAQNVAGATIDAIANVGLEPWRQRAPNAPLETLAQEGNPLALAAAAGFNVQDFTRQGGVGNAPAPAVPFDATGRLFSDTSAIIDRSFTSLAAQIEAMKTQLLDVLNQVKQAVSEQVLKPIIQSAIDSAFRELSNQTTSSIGKTLGEAAGPPIAKEIANSAPPPAPPAGGGGVPGGFAAVGNALGIPTYDIGGEWPTGTAGLNLSGGTEYVLDPQAYKQFATVGGVVGNATVGADFFGVSQIPILGMIINILVEVLLAIIGVEIKVRDTLQELTGEFRQFRGDTMKYFTAEGQMLNDTSALIERSLSSSQAATDERVAILSKVIAGVIQFVLTQVVIPIGKAVGNAAIDAAAAAAGGSVTAASFGVPAGGQAVQALISSAGKAGVEIAANIATEFVNAATPVLVGAIAEGVQGLLPGLVQGIFSGKSLANIFDPVGLLLGAIIGGGAGFGAWGTVGGLFDSGGMATGTGLMPKANPNRELMLSPQKTDVFERFVRGMEAGNMRGNTTINAPFHVVGGQTAAEQAHDRLLALLS